MSIQPLAILNGFGRTLGDGIIGVQALHVALKLSAIGGTPILYRHPHLPAMVEALYHHVDFAVIRELPWAYEAREVPFHPDADVKGIIDIRNFASDPAYLRTSMIDYFLHQLGLDPARIAPAMKHNLWLMPRVTPERPEAPYDYVLVCPRAASRIRDMPKSIHEFILETLRSPIVTQGAVPDRLQHRALSMPIEDRFEKLCGLVAYARHVITTDTAMAHLADAFNKPCLTFFPTHDPLWRVRDYPLCHSVPLATPDVLGLEFERSLADIAAAEQTWFPTGERFDWLQRLVSNL